MTTRMHCPPLGQRRSMVCGLASDSKNRATSLPANSVSCLSARSPVACCHGDKEHPQVTLVLIGTKCNRTRSCC